MNKAIISNWNSTVQSDDIVYCLGDLTLGPVEFGIELVKQLNGHIIVIAGNHDTNTRIELYETECPNIEVVMFADRIKYGKRVYFLCHYPSIPTNQNEKPVWCLHGHTHSKDKFSDYYPNCYNVSLDSHHNQLVNLDTIHENINYHILKEKKKKETQDA